MERTETQSTTYTTTTQRHQQTTTNHNLQFEQTIQTIICTLITTRNQQTTQPIIITHKQTHHTHNKEHIHINNTYITTIQQHK